MNITIINTHSSSGGAAKAALRLHKGLQDLGKKSFFYTTQENNTINNVRQFSLPKNIKNKIERFTRQQIISWRIKQFRHTRPSGYEQFSDCQSRFGKTVVDQMPICNVVNLHWIADFVDYASFFARVPQQTPIVWTLHDMNPFTGGCHYDDGCGKFNQACGLCPQLGSNKHNDLSAKIWKRKEAIFSKLNPKNLHLVTPSKWLADEASRSTMLKKFQTTIIPNSLNTDIFAPRDTNDFKQTLNIPVNARVILFVADSIEYKRKGLHLLLDAISSIQRQQDIVLLSVGRGRYSFPTSPNYIHIGQVNNERILSMIYSLADVFVLPSLQDNLPNTAMESLSCGTPIVGFNVGGVSDIVRDGQTGFLVPIGNVSCMKTAIEKIINNKILRKEISQQCRSIAVKEYGIHLQAKRYIELYRLLCKKNK